MENKMCAIDLIALSISKQDEKKAREEAARQEKLRKEQIMLEQQKRRTEAFFNEIYTQLKNLANLGEVPQTTFLLNETFGLYFTIKQVPWRYQRRECSNESDWDRLDKIDIAYLIKLFSNLCFECTVDKNYKRQHKYYCYGSGLLKIVQFVVKPQPECFSLLGEQAFGPGRKFFIKTP